jgi:hypothetical protein
MEIGRDRARHLNEGIGRNGSLNIYCFFKGQFSKSRADGRNNEFE